MPFVEFQRVSKIYSRQSREFVWRFLVEAFGGKKAAPLYALRDVDFRVDSGEAVAVVGRNGAGKTTLLSLVAGLTVPEAGRVLVEGRVSPLLELGAGYHPDLTGRENVVINAAVLGLGRAESGLCWEPIVEFAGLRDCIDEPLRTYSQGMVMRLAFAVAVHVAPDILLIDEVLAVGDGAFQSKCIERLKEMKRRGTILLCVSHVSPLLREICDRALWLEGGKLKQQGPVAEVLLKYEQASGSLPPISQAPAADG